MCVRMHCADTFLTNPRLAMHGRYQSIMQKKQLCVF